jgi:hypothetical protein
VARRGVLGAPVAAGRCAAGGHQTGGRGDLKSELGSPN